MPIGQLNKADYAASYKQFTAMQIDKFLVCARFIKAPGCRLRRLPLLSLKSANLFLLLFLFSKSYRQECEGSDAYPMHSEAACKLYAVDISLSVQNGKGRGAYPMRRQHLHAARHEEDVDQH